MTETTDDAATLRQTGAEAAPRKCPNCGGTLQVTESTYGSQVFECPKCREKAQAQARQQASQQQQSLPRETGTPVGNTPEAPNG